MVGVEGVRVIVGGDEGGEVKGRLCRVSWVMGRILVFVSSEVGVMEGFEYWRDVI